MEYIGDLPKGPLDSFRKKSSFNWKKMKLRLFTPDLIKISNEAYSFLESEPVFQPHGSDISLDELRQITLERMKVIYSSKIFYPDDIYINYIKTSWLNCILGSYDWSLLARKGLLKDFALSGIFGLGTERHMKYLSSIFNLEMGFAFCLTEISHGTNSKALRTEARYDASTKSFIIHTPDFEAAKCWAGCLGNIATHCLLFAQLYSSDGVCHGLHCFIVPVRDPKTLQPFPGVTIMDMGWKLGLNGLDNGVVMFDRYSIPKENLLNKTGDVSDDGVYISPFKDPGKRFGASLGNLSLGRISIIGFGLVNLQKALTISIRYSAVRKQFGPEAGAELPIIQYPLQQWRLFPYLASLYCLHFLFFRLQNHWAEFQAIMSDNNDAEMMGKFGQEMHALSSAGKPYSSWLARDAIQESREACGGHGYLAAAGFGSLRNDNDANCTYEGDNNVLLQQTSNWLLSLWSNLRCNDAVCDYPMETCNFLADADAIMNDTCDLVRLDKHFSDRDVIEKCVAAYQWLVCWLCETTFRKQNALKNELGSSFFAKNECQVFRAHSLSIVYFELVIIRWFPTEGSSEELQRPLNRLCALFALTRLRNHVALLTEGGLFSESSAKKFVEELHWHVGRLLRELLPDAVALVDACAPPDFVLGSVLGNADGKVYDHLLRAMGEKQKSSDNKHEGFNTFYKTSKL